MRNKNQYPENWNDTIRPRILKRDKFQCQHCDIKHRQYVLIDQQNKVVKIEPDEHRELKEAGMNTYRVYLQVAHLDNDKNNCSDENLLSLCPRCHLRNDKKFKTMSKNIDVTYDKFLCTSKTCLYAKTPHFHSSSKVYIKTAV